MKKKLKPILLYISIFLIIIILMIISFNIPQKYVSKNSIESIKYLKSEIYNSKTDLNYPKYLQYDNGDLRYSEMSLLVDNKHPVKSAIEMNSYLKGNLKTENYSYKQYARYWHAPVLYLRLLMVFSNIKTLIKIEIILLIIASLLLFIKLFKVSKSLSIAFIIIYIMFSLFGVYKNISYFNCTIISFISSIIIIDLYNKKKYDKYGFVFMINGLLVSLFDFLTIETLTLTMPMMILIILSANDKKTISQKKLISYSIIWFMSYITPFIIKNIINYFYFGKDVVIDVFNRYQNEGTNIKEGLRLGTVIKENTKLILPFYYLKHYYYYLVPIIILFIYNIIYLIDLKKYKGVIIVLIICILRYLLATKQAINLSFTTFRTIIPIYLFITYTFIKIIENIIKKERLVKKQK